MEKLGQATIEVGRAPPPFAGWARALLALAPLLLGGCGSSLMNARVDVRSRDWELAVRSVMDGPNSVFVQQYRYVPDDGGRFLHVFVTLRNVGAQRRKWNWARCGLDLGDRQYLPTRVLYDIVLSAPAADVLELDPNEEVERRIIFTYPEDALPARLTCGELVVPLHLRS
jgi:hypothetical protein